MKKNKNDRLKLSQRISDHLIQAVLIFASVFFAFWLNEYRIEKNENQYSKQAQETVLKELKNNLRILEKWTPYHKVISDTTLQVLMTQIDTISNFVPDRLYDSEKGIQREFITDYARHLINQLKMDLETKMLINRIYEQQKYVKTAFDDFFGLLKQREKHRENLVKENYILFYQFITEVYWQEKAMIEQYKIVIDKLEKKLSD